MPQPPRWLFPFSFLQPYDSIKHKVLSPEPSRPLPERYTREPRKITISKMARLIILPSCSQPREAWLHFLKLQSWILVIFLRKQGRLSLERLTWGNPHSSGTQQGHLPRSPTWPTWHGKIIGSDVNSPEDCDYLVHPSFSAIPFQLSLLFVCWWGDGWGKIDGPGQIRHRDILVLPQGCKVGLERCLILISQ